MKIWCVVIILLPFAKEFVSAAVELSSDAGAEVCSGTEVTFTCTASTEIVQWSYSGSSNTVSVDISSGQGTLGPFAVEPVTGNSSFLISTAKAAITDGVHGSLTCEVRSDPTDNDITVIPGIKGPPTFKPTLTVSESSVVPVGGDQWEFNLEWNSADCNLEYAITPNLPLPSDCTVSCTTQCRTFTLGRDDPRNFTVIAQNCGGTQSGSESNALQVCFELPDAPTITAVSLTYEKKDLSDPGELEVIQLTWSPVPDPEDLICGFNDSITGYHVNVTGMTSSGHETFQTVDVGRNESCACTVPEGIEHNVSVAAMNVLGLGDAAHVGTYENMENYITTAQNGNKLTVTCVGDSNASFTVTLDNRSEELSCSSQTDVSIQFNASPCTQNHMYVITGIVPGANISISGSISDQCPPDNGCAVMSMTLYKLVIFLYLYCMMPFYSTQEW